MAITSAPKICIPRATAYLYLALIIGTLLFVGVVEYLNGRRIDRLMSMLEEVAERESTTCSSRRADMKSMDCDDIGSEIVY
jgi:Flp pilus assembly protein TadB